MDPEHKWSVRARAASADDVTVFARNHSIRLGVPLSFDSRYGSLTALEQFLAAVTADLVGGLLARAAKQRLEIEQIEATSSTTLNNPLVYLDVVGEAGHPGIQHICVIVYISTLEDRSKVEKLWQQAIERSPLLNTLKNAVTLDLSYKIVL